MPPASDTARKSATRSRLLEVAGELFARLGYEATSPADIAAVAGIGRTTFYEYFTDKEDALAALVEEFFPRITADILSSIPDQLPARDQLAELAVRMVEFAATDHALGLRLHQEVPTLRSDTQARIAASHRELMGAFSRLYAAAVEAGELRDAPPDLAGRLIQDSIMAAAKVLMELPEPKARLHEVADGLVEFLLHGLGAR